MPSAAAIEAFEERYLRKPMKAPCGAHARTTGDPCKNWGMKNGRCRLHGGKATGRPIVHGRRRRAVVKANQVVRVLFALVVANEKRPDPI